MPLLSFSIEPMLPMVVNGLIADKTVEPGAVVWCASTFPEAVAAANGRQKRTTIRPRNPNGPWTRAWRAAPDDRTPLSCWWKSRVPEALGGHVLLGRIPAWTLEPIDIAHTEQGVRVCSEGRPLSETDVAIADGFEDLAAFRDRFVPAVGDFFLGWRIKW